MKPLFTLFLLFSFFSISCPAQLKQDEPSQDIENSLLWKISGNGLQHDSYLLGTMHSVEHSFLFSIPGFRKAFHTAKQIAVESDFFAFDSIRAKSKQTPRNYIFMPKDSTYEMLYNYNDFQFVDSTLKAFTNNYSRYRPIFLHNMLINRWQFRKLPDRQQSIDRYILLLGCQNNKKIFFMESLKNMGQEETKLDSLIYALGLHYQANTLLHILKNKELICSSLDTIENNYRKQELNKLSFKRIVYKDKNIPDSMPDILKQTESQLIDTRNEEWMKNLLPMINKDSSLIAVGAMHLIGDQGLITKLRKLGYIVEPVK